MSGGRAIPVSALAVGPLADPVYDTEIYALKDYVEYNLDSSQLDIMFFLIGGLAVAQMGAQDAMLISPYPNEENVKEWIINCGIQLYNSVIGLVPEGDYYMGIPSIGTSGTKGVPRQVIKGLVAQMMGDAVVAINYPDLDTFLEENPNEILLPFNSDLQLGVNAVFGLNGGYYDWQFSRDQWTSHFTWNHVDLGNYTNSYNDIVQNHIDLPRFPGNGTINGLGTGQTNVLFSTKAFEDLGLNYLYLNTANGNYYLADSSLSRYTGNIQSYFAYANLDRNNLTGVSWQGYYFRTDQLNINLLNYESLNTAVQAIFDSSYFSGYYLPLSAVVKHVYAGTNTQTAVEIFNDTDLNLSDIQQVYYQQVADDYLFDLRGLMGDLVNYVYTNKIWDNIYDLVGNLVLPDRVQVSVDLTPITDLLAPPVPVNLNDIAELTDNTYLERVKEHARNAGDIFANYVAFWHNCDSDLVYTMFGAAILVLVGAFVGKWGHS